MIHCSPSSTTNSVASRCSGAYHRAQGGYGFADCPNLVDQPGIHRLLSDQDRADIPDHSFSVQQDLVVLFFIHPRVLADEVGHSVLRLAKPGKLLWNT